MDYYKKAHDLLISYGNNFGLDKYPDMINAYATLALVEELREARKPVEITLSAVNLGPVIPAGDPRDVNFVPGDMVGLTIKSAYHNSYDGRHGVVTYGRDHAGGWIVTTAVGDLRCGPDELTMITRREDRTQETDRAAHAWKSK